MFGQKKFALMFAGTTLFAAALFASAFGTPAPGAPDRSLTFESSSDDYEDDRYAGDENDGDENDGDEGEPDEPDEYPEDCADDYDCEDVPSDRETGFVDDEMMIDDTRGFDPAPTLETGSPDDGYKAVLGGRDSD